MRGITRRPAAHRAARAGVSVGGSVARFVAAGLLALLALAATTGMLARRAGDEGAREAFADLTRVAGAALLPSVEGALAGDAAAGAALARQVTGLRAAGPVVAVRIWSSTGMLLWADDRDLAGAASALTDDQRRAARDGTTGVGEPGPGGAAGPAGEPLLEAYAGMTTASGRRVLVDLYEPYEVVLAAERAEWISYAPVALGALVLIELVQVPLAWRQARRLRRSEDAELQLLQAAITASDRERRRIAADLHDDVVQDLTGLAYDLDAARLHGAGASTELEQVLGRTSTRLRACIDALREVLVSLRTPRPAAGGLGPGLTALAAELEDAGLRMSVRISGADRIPPPVAAVLHRAAREALRNVRSHSGATSVELALRCHGNWATLVVEDDGRGFDATRLAERAASGHLGLRAVGDLLAGAGGTLTASSAPGAGTRLELRVPLDPSPVGAPL